MKCGCKYGENLPLSTVFLIFSGCSGTQHFEYSSAHGHDDDDVARLIINLGPMVMLVLM
jgi:hypothetical protein